MGVLYVYGAIGQDVTVSDVRTQLDSISDDSITVHINSPGGSVSEGFGIHDMLINSGKSITTIGEGQVASIATVILLAGSERMLTENSEFMIHNPWMVTGGEAEELEKQAKRLRVIEDRLANFYADRTGGSKEEIANMMKEETFMNAEKAMRLGFITDILKPVKAFAKLDTMKLDFLKKKEKESEESNAIDVLSEQVQGLVESGKNQTDINAKFEEAFSEVSEVVADLHKEILSIKETAETLKTDLAAKVDEVQEGLTAKLAEIQSTYEPPTGHFSKSKTIEEEMSEKGWTLPAAHKQKTETK